MSFVLSPIDTVLTLLLCYVPLSVHRRCVSRPGLKKPGE
jgi:hypothetical protein